MLVVYLNLNWNLKTPNYSFQVVKINTRVLTIRLECRFCLTILLNSFLTHLRQRIKFSIDFFFIVQCTMTRQTHVSAGGRSIWKMSITTKLQPLNLVNGRSELYYGWYVTSFPPTSSLEGLSQIYQYKL